MKKQYIAPDMKVVAVDSSEIICLSFGEGETNVMHARQRDSFFDEEDYQWDE